MINEFAILTQKKEEQEEQIETKEEKSKIKKKKIVKADKRDNLDSTLNADIEEKKILKKAKKGKDDMEENESDVDPSPLGRRVNDDEVSTLQRAQRRSPKRIKPKRSSRNQLKSKSLENSESTERLAKKKVIK